MNDSIVEHCESNNSGAGIQLVDGSVATIARSVIARCTSGEQGTGLTLFGANLNMSDSSVINNVINGAGLGVAITSAPSAAFGGMPDFDVAGIVQNCLFTGNVGQTTIYDGDRSSPPFNRLQFSGNTFFPTATAYHDDVTGGATTVAQLNALTIRRSDGTVTIKSPSPNLEGTASSSAGALLMIPPIILNSGAPGESTPIPAFIAYASTAPPTLDGAVQNSDAAVVTASNDGVHTLTIGSKTFSTTPPPAVARNIATRLPVGTAQNVLIGGFIIQGSGPKQVVIRAVGPSLSAFFAGALQDPRLELHDVRGNLIASNDNWRTTQIGGVIGSEQAIALEGSGLAPTDNAESAIIATLDPGNYTAIVSGANNATGIAVVEVYDLDPVNSSTLANIATRGFVQSGDNVMIGGFIYLGGAGATQVVVRGIGPSLSGVGITNPLSDPTLELHDGNGTTIATNDDWKSTPNAAAIQAAKLQPGNDVESAIYQTGLARGNYTAVLQGKNGGTGVGVVEVYIF